MNITVVVDFQCTGVFGNRPAVVSLDDCLVSIHDINDYDSFVDTLVANCKVASNIIHQLDNHRSTQFEFTTKESTNQVRISLSDHAFKKLEDEELRKYLFSVDHDVNVSGRVGKWDDVSVEFKFDSDYVYKFESYDEAEDFYFGFMDYLFLQ